MKQDVAARRTAGNAAHPAACWPTGQQRLQVVADGLPRRRLGRRRKARHGTAGFVNAVA